MLGRKLRKLGSDFRDVQYSDPVFSNEFVFSYFLGRKLDQSRIIYCGGNHLYFSHNWSLCLEVCLSSFRCSS